MINDKYSICTEGRIWDLHIHSCKSPKSSDEFSKLSVKEYIDCLDDIFSKHNDLAMISFTDHNLISSEVYQEAISRKWNISIIIGIEVDIFLDIEGKNKNDYKHIIFYFDPELFNLNEQSKLINKKANNAPLLLHDFLEFLITEIRVPFLISPHFMKQDNRGIEYYWNENADKYMHKYMDQLFCFWEASGATSIQRAEQFLSDFANGRRESIIAFSDSHDSKKLNNYLDNPPQFFNSLPSFSGLRMVGSDARRITKTKTFVKKEDFPLYIGKISQGDNNVVYLSPRLNSIIGGRGMGKSLLLDGICYYLDIHKFLDIDALKERANYISKLNYKVYDFNGNPLSNHSFKFEYFNQGYVLTLFKENKDETISGIYFKEEFEKIEKFNIETIRNEIISDISIKALETETINENIASICNKIITLDSESHDIHISSDKETKVIDYKDYFSFVALLQKPSITPQELIGNKRIAKAYDDLFKTIQEEIKQYNSDAIQKNIHAYLYKKYEELISKKAEDKKIKKNTIKLFKANLKNQMIPIANRVLKINAILSNQNKYSNERGNDVDGFNSHKFSFKRELNVEPLIKYLHGVFTTYFDKTKVKNILGVDRDDFAQLHHLIEGYCYFPEKLLLSSKTLVDLESEINTLENLDIKCTDEIYYFDGQKQLKLRELSPGTKANILMEYIVFKDSKVPLLIDQPEDNIDNKTIYADLTNWFSHLKNNRQVIVVTHDANIVINSDSENVIVCEQINPNVFEYKNGALEYSDIIDDASTILDGGREAIERRLMKYGENN